MSRHWPTLTVVSLFAGLVLLALGYWGAWLPHPAAGLNILGIDLPEYVKFVPAVQTGQISLDRLIFFAPLLALALGLILVGTLRRPDLPAWLRVPVVLLAIPTALAMLPPAWTPPLLRTPEFRAQTLWIGMIVVLAALSPLLRRFLPDAVRGIVFVALALFVFPALAAYLRLLPALETLYGTAVKTGAAFYLVAAGAVCLGIGGLLLVVTGLVQRRASADSPTAVAGTAEVSDGLA